MSSNYFGESIGSWIQWLVVVVISGLTIIFGSRRYLRDHSPRLFYRVLMGAEKEFNDKFSTYDGVTLIVQNFGGVATAVEFLGMTEHKSMCSWKSQMWLMNEFRKNKHLVRFINRLYPNIAKFDDVRTLDLTEFIKESFFSPNPELLEPYGQVKRIPIMQTEIDSMLVALVNQNKQYRKRIRQNRPLYFDFVIQTSLGNLERIQWIVDNNNGNDKTYQALISNQKAIAR